MKSRVEEAKNNHTKGCNCGQAVAITYSDLLGVDKEKAYAMTEMMGSGISGLRDICGAVNAGALVLSSYIGSDELYNKSNRKKNYDIVKDYINRFKEVDGSYLCNDILNKRVEGTSNFKTCTECVAKASVLLEEMIKEIENEPSV